MTDPIEDFQALIRWADNWSIDDDIERALDEDLGHRRHDITTESMIDRHTQGRAVVTARQQGILAGIVLIREIILHASAHVDAELHLDDAAPLTPNSPIATLTGPLRNILRVERTILNDLTHLTGIASLTHQYVQAVAHTNAVICDTRKTIPGLRWLAKYAVQCGGGTTHRIGLYDAVLIKDNHIAHVPLDQLTTAITDAAERARKKHKHLKFIEIEVDNLDQLQRVLAAPVDYVLLDNMPPDVLSQAVAIRDRLAPAVQLEASGGINLDTVRAIAQSGVDRISVGALTHSAPALDIGLDIAPLDPNTSTDPSQGLPS